MSKWTTIIAMKQANTQMSSVSYAHTDLSVAVTKEMSLTMANKPYIVSKCPDNDAYYCHHRDYSYIPVFGSIGVYRKAKKVCDIMNESVGKKVKHE